MRTAYVVSDGDLRDVLGVVGVYDDDVHPELRVLAYELTPSAFDVTDDDALDVLRSSTSPGD